MKKTEGLVEEREKRTVGGGGGEMRLVILLE